METNQLLINYYKKEEVKKIKARKNEGMTIDEIIRLANKEYITEDEILKTLGVEQMKDDEVIVENTEEIKTENKLNEITMINENELEDYPNQPFSLYDKDKKDEMIESIKINGIMQPLIVRKLENKKYQILAGHNRRYCAREAGLKKIPCIIKENITDDEAMIYLVDTNLCTREKISIMERARAYKMKYETYKRKNIKSKILEEVKKDNLGVFREKLIKEEKTSNGNIQRYLRLTYLIKELQEMVDKEQITIKAGEQISFLENEEQRVIAEILENEKIKLNENMAKRIRKLSVNEKINDSNKYLVESDILNIIKDKNKEKTNYIMIVFTKEEASKYFNSLNVEEIKSAILEMIKVK